MKRRRPARFAVALALLVLVAAPLGVLAGPAQATEPEVTVSVDKNRVTVGDPINLTVVVRHTPDVRIDTTSIDDQLGPLEPLSSQPPDERSVGGNLELRLRYTVAAYQTGAVPVPQFVFHYTLADGTQGQASARTPLAITVQSVIPADANPTDIKGLKSQFSLPVPASTDWALVALVSGLAAALALAVALTGLLLRRRAGRGAVAAPVSAGNARAELDRIMALDLLGKGEIVEHYRLLGACIRRYLTERFGFPAVALTTGELERYMEARGIERWPARLVDGLLNECDAVIYARYVPAAARAEADNAMAYEIVETLDGAARPVALQAV